MYQQTDPTNKVATVPPPRRPLVLTFALPVAVSCVAQVPGAFPVELGHQGPVRVPDQQDGRVEHLNLPPAALVGLHADGAPAPPVVLLALEPCPGERHRGAPAARAADRSERQPAPDIGGAAEGSGMAYGWRVGPDPAQETVRAGGI